MFKKYFNILIIASVISLGFLSACSSKENSTQAHAPKFAPDAMIQKLPEKAITDISSEEVQKIIDNPASKTIIIDARRPDEYQQGHIARAVNLNAFTATEQDLAQTFPDKNAQYVVYCAAGLRASAMHDAMVSRGYSNVKTLGGLKSHWKGNLVKD